MEYCDEEYNSYNRNVEQVGESLEELRERNENFDMVEVGIAVEEERGDEGNLYTDVEGERCWNNVEDERILDSLEAKAQDDKEDQIAEETLDLNVRITYSR